MNYDLFKNINKIRLEAIYNLNKNYRRNLNNTKLIYERTNNYFNENFNFLLENNIINIKNDKIFINQFKNKQDFHTHIFKKLQNNLNYAPLLKNYLNAFSFDKKNNFYFLKPDEYFNRLTSNLRNFLISMKIIKFNNDQYVIIKLDILTIFKNKKFTYKDFKKMLRAKEKIGEDAEKFVYKLELKKLKKLNIPLKPKYMSKRDVGAGYDIESYEKFKTSYKKIMIEVKAVKLSNYEFHLSINELFVARKNPDFYYLFLVPVESNRNDKFNSKNILKIKNIDKNILNNKIKWKFISDGLLISKKN
jgi:hypothetical protein